MMKPMALLGLFAVVLTGCDAANESCWVGLGGYAGQDGRIEDTAGTIAFVAVNLVSMERDEVVPGQTVLVKDGVITAIGSDGAFDLPEDAHRVDGCDRHLMPGLTDAHTHVGFVEDLLAYVANGVTTIINMGNQPDLPILAWRDSVDRGERLGPTIFAGRFVDGIRGEGPDLPFLIYSEEQAREVAVSTKSEGWDLIKVYNSLPLEFYQALMTEAKRQRIPVVGHGVREPGMQGILEAGQAMIVHAEEYMYTHFNNTTDTTLTPSAIEMTLDAGAYVVPNLSAYEIIARQWGSQEVLDELLEMPNLRYAHPSWREMWAEGRYLDRTGSIMDRVSFLRSLTGRFQAAGVPLLLGTDSPTIPGLLAGFSIHEDLRNMIEAGLTPYEALVAGTRNAGAFLETHVAGAEPVGTIAVGQRADLILLDGNPLEDVTNVELRSGVMARGRWLSEARLQQLLVAQLDSLR